MLNRAKTDTSRESDVKTYSLSETVYIDEIFLMRHVDLTNEVNVSYVKVRTHALHTKTKAKTDILCSQM
jgi:hypothetical protein